MRIVFHDDILDPLGLEYLESCQFHKCVASKCGAMSEKREVQILNL